MRHIAAVTIVTAVLLFTQTSASVQGGENKIPQMVDMTPAIEEPSELHALSAVLMDGDSGRVLYEKDGKTPLANASTTKVLTCIVALESSPGDDYVQVSQNAASQPEVRLGLQKGEQYYLEDLLYSLMLKSHNDTAVAIAEHCGGTVEGFARMLNRKAKQIGCKDTYFITPNGLDAQDENGKHHTTAEDLALIMRYAIKNKTFLHISQTRDYTFSEITGKRTFSVHNANALLDMMDGVLAGKTGYTSQAGYCYVCAWEEEGKTFVVSLLGCGWPNHKTYKWSDTKKLLSYGAYNYDYETYWQEPHTSKILVTDGVENMQNIGEKVYLRGKCSVTSEDREKEILLKKGEAVTCKTEIPQKVSAPVLKGEKLGRIAYYLDGKLIASYPVYAERSVEKISFKWYTEKVFHDFFH
ncbi:D-alanyl-D-alanine carboxypeptidase [Ruminococcus sp. AF37-6AT]|uniref:D-alanyl-D-alanine carboxypeptidase family protein n=1 Tax=Blautia sp. HCN-1074 TaxID=3134667 RepID=UPI000E42FA24|nr:D-alanyl-D-alanine carboxypeptidase family protein [uncultured Blautia sp.]RGI64664.1 D-alanyl-D-alanine carboxypeptidase [Ruminococcus sp. TM10-9AT]RGW22765.1 D-alanyl-D-alanine carboxypeptidase [Ruminococcus sp. AF13-37]RGW24521.1 D-alanyl-D-alanine carboxypeptidase [Ruminococcus sp. AF13-28]RGY93424.1 D-alanyl-D-alanine carboxypeptidase [Ruminococcus sp. AM58-7XD]RHD93615.1 D-alanyl-D-alanine carboxypeptidase [Ruminococcus sp. AM30-15AC]RHK00029.1 D-alanyl-D-alanine carboxypeptidase [Ru